MIKKNKYKSLVNSCQRIFNECVRNRDLIKDHYICISCGCKLDKCHAGHYFNTKEFPWLRFNFDNAHSQCCHCNTYSHGNLIHYRINLLKKIGEEALNELEAKSFIKKKFTLEELEEIKKILKEALKNK